MHDACMQGWECGWSTMRLTSLTARPKWVAWKPVRRRESSSPSRSRPRSKSQPHTVSASSGMLSEGASTACAGAASSIDSFTPTAHACALLCCLYTGMLEHHTWAARWGTPGMPFSCAISVTSNLSGKTSRACLLHFCCQYWVGEASRIETTMPATFVTKASNCACRCGISGIYQCWRCRQPLQASKWPCSGRQGGTCDHVTTVFLSLCIHFLI